MIKEAIRRTEAAFENSGYWIHDHPKRVILMMLLIVVFLAFHLPSIQFDTSTESFFSKKMIPPCWSMTLFGNNSAAMKSCWH